MKISEFILKATGKSIEEVKTGSELLLIAECNKYLAPYNEKLECDISVDNRLKDTEYACYMIEKGVSVDFQCSCEYTGSDFYLSSVEGIEFKEMTDELWVFNYMSNPVENSVFHRNRSKMYVSLLAYLLVYRVMHDTQTMLRIAQSDVGFTECEYAELLILTSYGNSLITPDILFLEMYVSNDDDGTSTLPYWEAEVIYNRQLGYMCRPYTVTEKLDAVKSKYAVDDIVLLYSRGKGSAQDNKIRCLESCAIAIIEDITESGITLRSYSSVRTVLTTRRDLDEAGGRDARSVYSIEDYRNFQGFRKTYAWSEMGVDNLLWNENYFIRELDDSDGSYQEFLTEEGVQRKFLPTSETIYAVFENRKVRYNRERFLCKYFANKTPYYESVRDIQPSVTDAISMSYTDMMKKYLNRG